VGACAGAYAGAWAAQRIAERSRELRELLAEIRNTNAAIMLAVTVWNGAYGLKKQHVKALHDGYKKQREELAEYERKRASATVHLGLGFSYHANLMTLPPITLPVHQLQTHVFEKVSVPGRPLIVVPTIAQTADMLVQSIEKRNELVGQFKKLGGSASPAFHALYFGLVDSSGNQNVEYPDTVEAISVLTDSLMYFTELLCKDLRAHGALLVDRIAEKGRKNRPTIHSADFDKAKREGLAPDEADFASWRDNFVSGASTEKEASG
jgi:hypothetical protein